MKVSIITVVYNGVHTIADTIESVIKQTYDNIEYIVVDGQSSDGTIDVVQRYLEHISFFVSEKDKGLYDAINKGIGLATGEVVGILHADDIFNADTSVAEVVQAFKNEQIDCIYGDLVYVDKADTEKVFRNWKSGSFARKKFKLGWMPPHPTFYARRECFQKYGTYDTSFSFSADYELMLRFLCKHKLQADYVDSTLVRMRVGGVSNSSFRNRLQANKEDLLAWKKNNLRPHACLRLLKPLQKIAQLSIKSQVFKLVANLSVLLPLLLFLLFSRQPHHLTAPVAVALSTVFSWGIVMISIPIIIRIANEKQLMDVPNRRSSHNQPIPTLGGIAVFAALMLSLVLWVVFSEKNNLQYLMGALIIIFFIGLKDDMLVISPRKKMLAQLVSALLIIQGMELPLQSFDHIFGIGELPAWFGLPFTVLAFVIITNAYNLIDGIDGLASSLGISTCSLLGIWFILTGNTDLAVLAFSITGALVAFIRFNFSKRRKIFLGDTGSLIIGTVCATLVFQFIRLNAGMPENDYYIHNASVVAIALVGIPLLDLLRLFVVRLCRRQSPFKADRNHVHHLMIDLSLSHKHATAILCVTNSIFGLLFLYICASVNPTVALFTIVVALLLHTLVCHQLQFSKYSVRYAKVSQVAKL